MRRLIAMLASVLLLAACQDDRKQESTESALPGEGNDAGKIVVYRDDWGIPHIYAPTVAEGLYAMGRAQAQDRPKQLLVNFKMAMGEYASIVGEGAINHDLTHRMFDHYGASERAWAELDAKTKAHMKAFAGGIRDHYAEHPSDLPAWWGERPIDVHMVGAFGRYFLYNWAINEAYGDLRRAGVDPGFVPRRHASNQWAVGPSRSASGNALLLADPHLGWWGVTRFWELRVHAGELHGSGVGLPGSPYIGLGHNENVAWAMTTGGPDTADVFELTLDPDDHRRYRYDDEWREMTSRTISLEVNGGEDVERIIHFSHHGPVIAWDLNGETPRAYSGRIAYDDSVNPQDLTVHLNFGDTVDAAAEGLASLGSFPQNVMVADTSGNIYYQRAGRVPVRAEGYDWSRPVDGSTSETDWDEFHPSSSLLQIKNPPQGYMQNTNVPPDAMMVNGPFEFDDYLPEIYSSAHYGPARHGWVNQRGARALELLSKDDSISIEEARDYALDVKPYGIERWLDALGMALGEPEEHRVQGAAEEIRGWNGELRRDSGAALKYAYFRFALAEEMTPTHYERLRDKIDQWYRIVDAEAQDEVTLTATESEALRQAFTGGLDDIEAHFGSLDAVYGDAFRVGRDDRSWPVGGGGDKRAGLRTLRTLGYGDADEHNQRWGVRGQTSTQVIELSTPIKSWIYLPVGQSDRPDSPHYDDQAEQLFGPRQLKPSRWLPGDLVGHIESRTVYSYEPEES